MPCRVDLLRLCMHGFRSNENRTTAQNQRYCTRLLNNQRSEADCTTPKTLPRVCKRLLKMTLALGILVCGADSNVPYNLSTHDQDLPSHICKTADLQPAFTAYSRRHVRRVKGYTLFDSTQLLSWWKFFRGEHRSTPLLVKPRRTIQSLLYSSAHADE